MSRKINPFVAIYLFFVFLPVAMVTTIVFAVATIIMIPIWGDSRWGYYPGKLWAKILCTVALVRVKVEGCDNMDSSKSYVFIANHQSIFDIFLVYGWLNIKFKWIMKKELRRIPFVGKACEMMGHIFIDRSNPIRARQSLEVAEKRLRGGGSIFIFPEGTRTRTGMVGKFKKGAFTIAKDLKLPVIPVSIIGAYDVMPYNSWYIKPGIIKMVIQRPIPTESLNDKNMDCFVDFVCEKVKSKL